MNGQTLKKLRIEKGLQQQFVAKAAGLTKYQLSDIESESRGIDVEEFVRIAQALGYKPGDLLENSGGYDARLLPFVDHLRDLTEPAIGAALQSIQAIAALDLQYRTPAEELDRVADSDNVIYFHREAPQEMTEDQMAEIERVMGQVGAEPRRGARGKEFEVPVLGTVSAGRGIIIFEMPNEQRLIPEYYWNKGVRAVFKAIGDSMRDVGIWDHDILFVKPTPHARNNQIVIATLNRKAYVKKFVKDKNQLRLISESAGYEPIEITEDDEFQIYGVVIGRTGDL